MKLYVIPRGTKVCLGSGDGELRLFRTTREFSFHTPVSDPIYYHNNQRNEDVAEELNRDTVIRAKGRTVCKYDLGALGDGVDYGYRYLYVNFKDVSTLC